jgi:carbon-monoxide dehydrogenase medium subunit
MKPPRFEYVRPASLEEAVAARAAHEDTVILAGGQSLMPMMNFRLAQPDAVIDISRIPGLDGIEVSDDAVSVGAMVRSRALELHDGAFAKAPVLRAALHHVAHVPIRNRGTVCGSIAHADPAAELPAVLLALDGHVVARGAAGERLVPAAELFAFQMTTTLAADEIVVKAVFPAQRAGEGHAFLEYARRQGDYAMAAVCALVTMDGDRVAGARLAACGIADTPIRLTASEAALAGKPLDEARLAEAAAAAREAVTNDTDGAGGAYRRRLLSTLVTRAVREAAGRTGA